VLVALACTLALSPSAGARALPDETTALYLVTFEGPGTAGHHGDEPVEEQRELMREQQEAALAAVSAPDPVYRWTTALNGVAVELTPDQAAHLPGQDGVATVQQDEVRALAGTSTQTIAPTRVRGKGGTGVVIGVVDTGIWPDSPLFADSPALARRAPRFTDACASAEDWSADTCNAKLVAGRWFVDGFGADRVAADEPLSPRDVRGHGTQVASIAAGNSGVSVGVPGLPGTYGGVAPRAGVAAYKACWSAPDPDDDGCSTADLVAAVDAATRDRVDVLNLSVAGSAGIDTVERALLGAAEAGIVVMAAAGSAGADDYATHVSPWVTTLGSLATRAHAGTVAVRGRRLDGVMTAQRTERAPGVVARTIPAPGHSAADAARCVPGSLDAARAADRIVVCERGTIGRIEKSTAVARANGAGMVLVNTRRGSLPHDLHAVPTVHLGVEEGETLLDVLGRRPRAQLVLAPGSRLPGPRRVASGSPSGDPGGSVLKPDLVAEGTGVLAGTPPTVTGKPWTFLSGTSAATAHASGTVARLLARHDWSAPVARSVLSGSGRPTTDDVMRSGAGVPDLRPARPGRLAHDVAPGDYRAWLTGDRSRVNTPSVLFDGAGEARRRVTNVGDRADTWRAEVSGFERFDVTVSPATLTLEPGGSATYRVTAGGGSLVGGLDDGAVTWVAGDGSRTRVPVAIGR
jgi:minor extracellular serine protease Vpr